MVNIPLDRYPRDVTLRDGARITFRPMVPGDAERLREFLRAVPPEDRMHLREDADQEGPVAAWAASLDHDTELPILAWEGDRIVGNVTLHRKRTGWKQRVGTVRILVAPDFRHRGLGTAMIREVRLLAEKAGLRYLRAEVVEEQQAAVRALESLGFERVVVYRSYVNDPRGHLHNLVVLLYPMGEAEAEMNF